MFVVKLRKKGLMRKPYYSLVVGTKKKRKKIYEKIGTFQIVFFGNNDEVVLKYDQVKLSKWLLRGATISSKLKKYL